MLDCFVNCVPRNDGSMKALLSHTPGGPETLQLAEVPDPAPGPGELLVRVRACAINYPDVLIIEDKYQFKPPRPFAPGGEIAGEVEASARALRAGATGDRLIALFGPWRAGRADRQCRPRQAFRLPDGIGFAEGSALLITYGTTIHALVDRGRLKAGETLLVLGAAGGVGLSAVEIGKALGARVVAAVSSRGEGAGGARGRGGRRGRSTRGRRSTRTRRRPSPQLFKDAVGPAGADVILDPVGGDYAEPALRSIGWEGRYLVVGFPAGIPKLPLNLTLLKSCDVCGVFWGAFAARDPKAQRRRMSSSCFAGGPRARSRPRSARLIRSSAPARRSPRCATARRSASWW